MNEQRKDIIEVYYSSKCNVCKKFLQELYDNNLLSEIDQFHSYEKIIFPVDITHVPTLKINNNYFSNEKAFKWIEYKNKTSNNMSFDKPKISQNTPLNFKNLHTLVDDDDSLPSYNFTSKSLIPNVKEENRSIDDLIKERKMF